MADLPVRFCGFPLRRIFCTAQGTTAHRCVVGCHYNTAGKGLQPPNYSKFNRDFAPFSRGGLRPFFARGLRPFFARLSWVVPFELVPRGAVPQVVFMARDAEGVPRWGVTGHGGCPVTRWLREIMLDYRRDGQEPPSPREVASRLRDDGGSPPRRARGGENLTRASLSEPGAPVAGGGSEGAGGRPPPLLPAITRRKGARKKLPPGGSWHFLNNVKEMTEGDRGTRTQTRRKGARKGSLRETGARLAELSAKLTEGECGTRTQNPPQRSVQRLPPGGSCRRKATEGDRGTRTQNPPQRNA